ncbi:MAG: hypothetical protein HYR55_04835 [Acidobacteria bacterium]|nr:hypothetical protein [Acidobacteriota bacterium]MBI3654975.1 hypothetical protein [Acidobacteriota bacterium]
MDSQGKSYDPSQPTGGSSAETPKAAESSRQVAATSPASAPGGRAVLNRSASQTLGRWNMTMLALTVLIFGTLCYTLYDQSQTKKALEAQIKKADDAIAAAVKRLDESGDKIVELRSDIDIIQKFSGIRQQEARTLALRLKQDQEKSFSQLNSQIARKADTVQLSELRQEAENKLGAVTTDVTTVKGDVTTVKTEIASTRQDLQNTRRELLDVHEQLRSQVAKNYGELADLKRKGERDYIEFTIGKKNSFQKVGDINLALKKTNPKKQRYDILVTVDDNQLEKKDRMANEPVQFLVGKDRLRYELVVFTVGKDRIAGYLSTPKDRKLGAERPQ